MSESASSAVTEPFVFSFDLTSEPLVLEGLQRLRAEVQSGSRARDQFRNVVESIPDEAGERAIRRGIGYWLLGRNADALETLKGSKSTMSEYVRARALLGMGSYDAAREIFEQLTHEDGVGPASRFGLLECHMNAGNFDAFAKALKSLPKSLQETADAHYYHGRLAEEGGDHEGAIERYRRALEIHPEHRHTLFRLAYVLDLRGMDDEAVRTYEQLTKLPPVDVATVMNLGLLYEDRGEYQRAIACYDAVLKSDPTNSRARLYRADADASLRMYYDETQERRDDKLQQTLRIPITDFELSVRARNCLTKMNIKSLGDLVRKTEAELLSYKNFGETSLNEIKAILGSKNLRLGMLPPERQAPAPETTELVGSEILSKPIHELDLSVRSRRTVDALNIRSVGDLLQHTAEELLAMPNFGQTSLNEIRMKLRTLGVDLRDSKGGGIPGLDIGLGPDLKPVGDDGLLGADDLDEDDLDEDGLEDEELNDAEEEVTDSAEGGAGAPGEDSPDSDDQEE